MQGHEDAKAPETEGFGEPLFSIKHAGRTLLVLGANNKRMALWRAEMLRSREVALPRAELLEAEYLSTGPVSFPFYSGSYFRWLETLSELPETCPICGASR